MAAITPTLTPLQFQQFFYGNVSPQSRRIAGCHRRWFPIETDTAGAEVWQTSQRILMVAWEAATSSDAVAVYTEEPHHSSIAFSHDSGDGKSGVVQVWQKGGKRPLQTNSDAISSVLPTSWRQEPYRPRMGLRQRFLYFTLSGDASDTYTHPFKGVRHVYWCPQNFASVVAVTSSGQTVTFTQAAVPDIVYGTLVLESDH